jgi:hypothetical protein
MHHSSACTSLSRVIFSNLAISSTDFPGNLGETRKSADLAKYRGANAAARTASRSQQPHLFCIFGLHLQHPHTAIPYNSHMIRSKRLTPDEHLLRPVSCRAKNLFRTALTCSQNASFHRPARNLRINRPHGMKHNDKQKALTLFIARNRYARPVLPDKECQRLAATRVYCTEMGCVIICSDAGWKDTLELLGHDVFMPRYMRAALAASPNF